MGRARDAPSMTKKPWEATGPTAGQGQDGGSSLHSQTLPEGGCGKWRLGSAGSLWTLGQEAVVRALEVDWTPEVFQHKV